MLIGSFMLTTPIFSFAQSTQLSVQKSYAQAAHLTTRIEWSTFPQLTYSNDDLNGQNRAAILRIYSDEAGNVSKTSVQESTGIKKLDQLLIDAVEKAKTKPIIINDTALPTIGYQVFNLNLLSEEDACQYAFDSKQWLAQKQKQKTAFQYRSQPQLSLLGDELNEHSRSIKFNFKVDKQGKVKRAKISKGSGVYDLDQKILAAIEQVEVDRSRKASSLWLYKPSKFNDEIQFNLNACQ